MRDRDPPAPVHQQAPPTHAAARHERALRDARGSLPLMTGTASRTGRARREAIIRIDAACWQLGYDAGLSGVPSWLGRRNLAAETDSWSWSSGYIEGEAARLKRGSQATSKLDANREY